MTFYHPQIINVETLFTLMCNILPFTLHIVHSFSTYQDLFQGLKIVPIYNKSYTEGTQQKPILVQITIY